MIQTVRTPSSIDVALADHGAWRVLAHALAALLRQRPRTPPVSLNDHLRRDIGLEPLHPPPSWWEHMR